MRLKVASRMRLRVYQPSQVRRTCVAPLPPHAKLADKVSKYDISFLDLGYPISVCFADSDVQSVNELEKNNK